MDVTAQEAVALMQNRFPKEFEICVLAVQNQKLQQQLELQAAEEEEEAPD